MHLFANDTGFAEEGDWPDGHFTHLIPGGRFSLKRILPTLFLLVALTTSGCQDIQRLLHEELDEPSAPTTVPLPSLTPLVSSTTATEQITPTSTPAGDETATVTNASVPTPAKTAMATSAPVSTPAESPTRIISPEEPINLPPGFGISVFAQGLRD